MRTAIRPLLVLSFAISSLFAEAPEGFTPLFNGKDLSGWKVPAGDGGHWKVLDGVIDYDAESQAAGEYKNDRLPYFAHLISSRRGIGGLGSSTAQAVFSLYS